MSIMKYCVILGCFMLCIWAQTSQAVFQDKAFEEHFAKCAEELKLTKDDIEKLKKKENLTDERYKCLGKCVGEKEGLIKDGMYNKEGAKKIAMKVFKDNPDHLKKAEEVVEECEQKLKKKPTTGCEVGPDVLGCLIEGANSKKIMPEIKQN